MPARRWFLVLWWSCSGLACLAAQNPPSNPQEVVAAYWSTYRQAVRQNHYLAFTPPVIPLANGMTSLDTASYFRELRLSPHLSTAFLQQERQRLQPCLDTLASLPYREYLKNDEAESYAFHCPFFMVFPLFFGPHFFEPTAVSTVLLSQSADRATVKITLTHPAQTQTTFFELYWEANRWSITRGYY